MLHLKRYKRILLFSGGIDSFVAYHYLKKPQTLYFDIDGRYSEKEKKVVRKLIPTTIIDYSLMLQDIETETAYVPFRNLFFFMMAAARYSDLIYLVGIKDDNVSDKNKEIFKEFSNLLSKLEGRKIRIVSPFWSKTKYGILRWYLQQGYSKEKLEQTISCYSEEDTNYCGKCASCFRKWVAFWLIGIKKEFFNQEMIQMYKKRCEQGYYNLERNRLTLKVIKEYEKGISN